jgi:hypothetical protein
VTCLAGGERKSKHCAIISSVKPTTPYNKVHNRGCSLSTFFSFYMRHQQRQQRKKSAATSCKKKEPVESVFIKTVGWAASSTLRAGNKQKRMLNYLQETKVPAALRWPFFLFSLFP